MFDWVTYDLLASFGSYTPLPELLLFTFLYWLGLGIVFVIRWWR